MPNSIVTGLNAAYVAGSAEANAPILKLTNHTLDKAYGNDSGERIIIKIADYGTVTEGEALGNTDVIVDEVDLRIGNINTGASLGIVEESVKIGNYKEVVAKPRGAKLANYIQRKVFQQGLLGAGHSVVAASGSFAQLGTAISKVEASEMSGTIGGMLGYDLHTAITNSGISQFGNSSLAGKLYQGVIGNYNGVDFVKGPSALVTTGASLGTAGATATLAATPGSDGLTVISFFAADGTTPANQTLTRGSVINLAGVYATDEFGNTTSSLFSFVIQDGITATATAKVQPIYFTGPRKNVSVTNVNVAVPISSPMAVNKTYMTGLVFNKNDIVTVAKAISPFPGTESISLSDVETLPVRMSAQGNVNAGTRTTRWDFLFGSRVRLGRATCGLYVPIN
jgi:hypothetical protein